MDALFEIESRGERIIEWVGNNARIVLGVAAGLLVVAAIIGFASGQRERRELAASTAYEATRGAYLEAMGASPGALTAPQLANPAAAVQIRKEYADRFAAIAQAHPKTPSGALASLDQGDLVAAGGDAEAARGIWETALAGLPSGEPVAGLLYQRIGRSLEDTGDWSGAADAYAAAGAIEAYTFRYWAMAEAARCYAAADQAQKALDLFTRIESEAPELELPDDLRVRLRELRAANPG
jgi:hypothetical protein